MGLTTLDIIYLTPTIPAHNAKIVAVDQAIASGGPATNAAVTFSHLGNQAILVGVIGNHPISQIIRADLESHEIEMIDLDPDRHEAPPVSSIMVTQATGERAVISINALKSQAPAHLLPPDIAVTSPAHAKPGLSRQLPVTSYELPGNMLGKLQSESRLEDNAPTSSNSLWCLNRPRDCYILKDITIVLIDGHQMAVSRAIALEAKKSQIPVVLDGGSWKPGLEEVLPFVDYAICSANFQPPNCHNQGDVFTYLSQIGIPHIAITQGEKPIQYLTNSERGELGVPQIQPVDTLGAGDIFHGAFCHYICHQDFIPALGAAAKIASHSCQFFGTRQLKTSPRLCASA